MQSETTAELEKRGEQGGQKVKLADDLLRGVKEISDYTGFTERQVYDVASRGLLPLFKLPGGRTWHGRKSTLRQHIAKLEAKHGEAANV